MSELTEKISGRENIYGGVFFVLQTREEPQWTGTSICCLDTSKPNSPISCYSRDVWFPGIHSTSQNPSEVFVTTFPKAPFPYQSWQIVTESSTRAKPPATHPFSHVPPKPAVPRLPSLPSGFPQGYRKMSAEASWRLSVYYICVVTLTARKLGSQV